MNIKRLLLTDPNPKYAKAAKEEGFYLIILSDNQSKNEYNLQQYYLFADELYVIDFRDSKKIENLIDWIHTDNPLDYIYHLGKDEYMKIIYSISEKYNLSLNPLKAIIRMNDKYEMRKYFGENGISSVQYKLTTFHDIEKDVKLFGFPLIIKPTNLSGSRGVFLCEKEEDVLTWKNYMSLYNYEGAILIEEFLEGREISVETLSLNGKHHVIGITDKQKTSPPLFIELGHIFPANLKEEIEFEILDLVIKALDLIEYEFGPAHTEIILTKAGPKIVEMHSRLAGDRIPILVKESMGIKLENLIIKMLNGHAPLIGDKKLLSKIHFFQFKPGHIKEINGIEEIKEISSVKLIHLRVKPQMKISEVRDSSQRHGYVIVTGESMVELDKEIRKVESLISISYY
ncbi:ATP-grasp domain-containing protein [Bacillus cereus]